MTTEAKTRTITLTDRPPVRIREDEWPVIASAEDDSWAGHRGDGRYHQALNEGSLDRWTLKVRQHEDGRTIVYGVLIPATFSTTPGRDWRGGELLPADVEASLAVRVPAAIRRVGEAGDFPDHLIRECIADLPPEEL